MEQWDEFNDKYGFDGGACVTPADFHARKYIVKVINERLAALDSKDIRLVEWDRSGFHNPCMILVLEWDGKMSDEELLHKYQHNEVDEVEDFDPSDLNGESAAIEGGDWYAPDVFSEAYANPTTIMIDILANDVAGSVLFPYVHLAKKDGQPVVALLSGCCNMLQASNAELNAFLNGWVSYAGDNGYEFSYNPKFVQRESFDAPWQVTAR